MFWGRTKVERKKAQGVSTSSKLIAVGVHPLSPRAEKTVFEMERERPFL